MADNTEAEVEDLQVAATRPPLVPFLGIPFGLFTMLLTGSFAIANLFHATILGLGTGAIIAGFSSLLVRRDYNGVRIFGIWARLSRFWLSASRMGGMTPNHFPAARRRWFQQPPYRGVRIDDAY